MKSQLKPNYTERYYDEVDRMWQEWRRPVWEDSLGDVQQEKGGQIGASGWVEVLDASGNVVVEINQDGMTWAHAETHEDGGVDEISIQGLAGTPLELTNHLNDAVDAHDASAVSLLDAAGHTTATEVESAIAELYSQTGTIVTDHGGLTGLGDDDHPQYATNVEFDDHSARHENGGADEISVAGLAGLLADAQTPLSHAASHAENAADEILVEGLGTASLTTTHVLAPDGLGGVEFRAETEGVTDHGALTGLGDDDHPQYETSAEVDARIATHAAAVDPHPTYETSAEVDTKIATHSGLPDPHTVYLLESNHTEAAHTAMAGLATQAELDAHHHDADYSDIAHHHDADYEALGAVATHAGLADPHTGYVLESAHTLAAHDTLGLATQTELDTHAADTTSVHGIADTSVLATDAEVTSAISDHEGLADPHTGYRLESADHSHASTGLQGGTIAHSVLTGLTTGDPHTQYQKESEKGAASGYASLDGSTKVPIAEIPTGTTSTTVALGNHNHSALYQPLDADLTSIAALTTTAYGRAFLTEVSDATVRANLDLEPGVDFPSLTTFNDHSSRHENGGADEITVLGLSGELADAQKVKDHTHGATGTGATGGGSTLQPTLIDMPNTGQIDLGDVTITRSDTETITVFGTENVTRLRITATDDVSLASTLHGLQVGDAASTNIAMDNNEMQARNNGTASELFLNLSGGDITLGSSTSTINVTGTFLPRYIGARVYSGSTQSISHNTPTALSYTSEEYDTESLHSTATNPSRITIPANLVGKWRFRANVRFPAAGGLKAIWFRKNGSDVRGSATSINDSGICKIQTTAEFACSAGDYIETFVYQSSGVALNVGHAAAVEDQHTIEASWLGTN